MIVLIFLLKVCVCQAIFYGFYRLIIQRETHFSLNRFYLLLSVAFSFIIPYLAQLSQLFYEPVPIYIAPISEFIYQAEFNAVVIGSETSNASSFLWLKCAYALGVLLCIVRFSYGLLKIIRLNKSSHIDHYDTFDLALTSRDLNPFSFLNTIYISNNQQAHQSINDSVLKHELAHIRGRHSWDILFIEIAKALTWFNPIIYLIKKDLKETHEYIADQEVLSTGHLAQYYQHLINQSLSADTLSLAVPFNQSNIKKRIIMMNRKRSASWKKYKYLFLIPIIGILVSAFRIDQQDIIPDLKSNENYHVTDSTPVYKMVEQMPRFPGCEHMTGDDKELKKCADQKMLEYIYQHVNYPAEARKNGVQGKVIISFVVNRDGSISQAKILKDPGAGLGTEALRVTESMNHMSEKWIPGKEAGKIVRVQYNLPIIFRLEGDMDEAEVPAPPSPPSPPSAPKAPPAPPSPPAIGSAPPPPPPPPANICDGDVFKIVEQMPRFPGCEHLSGDNKEIKECADQKMLEYIYKNVKYPTEARKNGVEGQVVISFIVEKDGSITEEKILRDPGAGLGEEALRVVHAMNNMSEKWTPGRQRGKSIRVQYNLPVKFKLSASEAEPVEKAGKESIPPSSKKSNHEGPDKKEVFKVVEQMPRFPGCENLAGDNAAKKECAQKKMLEYIYQNIKYPDQARKDRVEGTVVITFTVNSDGSIANSHIVRNTGAGLGEEALRVIQSMNNMTEKWTPGQQRGKSVRVQYNLPIKFKLPAKHNSHDK